jgi:hypothetical protein
MSSGLGSLQTDTVMPPHRTWHCHRCPKFGWRSVSGPGPSTPLDESPTSAFASLRFRLCQWSSLGGPPSVALATLDVTPHPLGIPGPGLGRLALRDVSVVVVYKHAEDGEGPQVVIIGWPRLLIEVTNPSRTGHAAVSRRVTLPLPETQPSPRQREVPSERLPLAAPFLLVASSSALMCAHLRVCRPNGTVSCRLIRSRNQSVTRPATSGSSVSCCTIAGQWI